MITLQTLTPVSPDWTTAAAQIGAIPWSAGPHLSKVMTTADWQPWERVVYATDGDHLVGCCALLANDIVPDTDYTPFISTVYVDPTYRQRGISLKLVRTAEQAAVAANITGLYIVTRHVGLYEHLDYRLVDQQNDRFGRPSRILYKALVAGENDGI
ncbi:GNAT family N-acetyltransferase [Levilactobacillus humaensis]|uniref:GNAT family N-acetyltransferase n=1 Tax=Levilactobacillus humaensis TaxID=2950375 RepID=UPI0021C2D399|nr:GNAT family N-acetyltransferase [Levilactobacillus humaensis]